MDNTFYWFCFGHVILNGFPMVSNITDYYGRARTGYTMGRDTFVVTQTRSNPRVGNILTSTSMFFLFFTLVLFKLSNDYN